MKPSLFAYLTVASATLLIGSTLAHAGETATRTPAEEIAWGETPFGPLASPVSGDFSAGQHITFIKFPAGMQTPVHTHSYDYVGIVISGVTRHFEPGKPETEVELSAGSHWSIPAGLPHISECLPGTDCVMAIYQDESFDFRPTN
jgi:quercetin dioxygenase-like cupin family protein